MALTPGTRFGPYEIADEIGAGGMGVVYRATDTTLDREVAIKVLPASMAADADRIARFDREAKTLASLNHPNIATIHGLERADGTTALVMELVEGPTLADRIEQGAIPADEALGIAMQIAEALEAAHGRNIVHRDLKPANIKLRPDGMVKVLDFGIAKALEPETVTSVPQSPVLTTPATLAGVILGTAAYMSPEQARGKPVDQRADIWAFGCVLYEMLTGQPAFGGEDVPLTLARVLDRDTDLESLPAAISPAVRRTIQLCLQKDANKRVADIRDVKLALGGEFETVSPQVAEALAVQPLWRRAMPIAAAVLVTGVLVGLAGEMLRPASSSAALAGDGASSAAPIRRFAFNVGATTPLGQTGLGAELAISPDGSRLVYTANVDDAGIQLYMRPLDQFESQPVAGAEGARGPSFSPDGEWLVFGSGMGAGLRKISTRGGPSQTLTENINRQYGSTWGTDDTIIYSTTNNQDLLAGFLSRIPSAGGIPEVITTPEPGTSHIFPSFLPGSQAVLFTTRLLSGPASQGSVAILDLETGEQRELILGGFHARYVPTGHIVFLRSGALWAVPFDLERREISGTETPIVENVASNGELGHAAYGFSDDGMLAYVRGGDLEMTPGAVFSMLWVDREGREESLDIEAKFYLTPRLSPDGQRLAVTIADGLGVQVMDVWIYDLTRGTASRLTFDSGVGEMRPVWTPDGQSVAYFSSREEAGVFQRAANGTGPEERLTTALAQQQPEFFTPDGSQLVFRTDPDGHFDLHVQSLEDDSPSTPLLEMDYAEGYSALSPDGRWLAYSSNETETYELYVRPFPDVEDGKWQISTGGGVEPLWSPDGRELFYRGFTDGNNDSVMVVAVDGEDAFSAGPPQELFADTYYFSGATIPNWDISSDGQRFLMLESVLSASQQTTIGFVENWFEELRRLAPAAE